MQVLLGESIPFPMSNPSKKALVTASPQKGDFPNPRCRAIDDEPAFSYGSLVPRASIHSRRTKHQESGTRKNH